MHWMYGLAVCTALAVSSGPVDAATPSPPNVVIIYGDDVGYGDVGVYGAELIPTPNIDRLAARGLRFTDAHCTASTCTPSRFSMLTGVHGFRAGVRVLPPNAPLIIPTGALTLPMVFRQAGYVTGIVGKWHLGLGAAGVPTDWNGDVRPGPLEIGFDHSFLLPSTNDRVPCVYLDGHRVVNLDPADPLYVGRRPDVEKPGSTAYPDGKTDREAMTYYRSSHGHDNSVINGIGRIGYMSGGRAALWDDETMADVFVDRARTFIADNRDRPFFLYFSSQDIHVPRTPHPRFQGASGLGYRGDAMVQFDWAAGAILDTLETHGLADNTIVILTSDNGPVYDDGYDDGTTVVTSTAEVDRGHDGSGPWHGGKYQVYEGGTRVPFIVRWPERIEPGVSDALVSQIDFIASFAAMLGVDVPVGQARDSRDTLAAFLGDDPDGLEYMIEESRGPALRQGDWKYIPARHGDGQLFDLADDPGESTNIVADHPERAASMDTLLTRLVDAAPRASAYRDLTFDGAWCWFADPRAVYHEGAHRRTYAGWVNSQGDILIGSFDHETGAMRSNVLHRRLERDDHANPALLVLPDGRLAVFYSRHADTVMRLRISEAPESIDAWAPEVELSLNDESLLHGAGFSSRVCYPNPALLIDEDLPRITLFWRGVNWKPNFSFSDDLGKTWSPGVVAFEAPDADAGNRPYLKASGDNGRRVHLAMTTGHPRNEPANSIYYCVYEDGVFRRADGTVLGSGIGSGIGAPDDLPLPLSACDVVYDGVATGVRSWIWDVAQDSDGRPVLVYTRLPAEDRHVYHYARWNGARWIDHPITDAGPWFPRTPAGKHEPEPHYSGGIVLDHDDPSTVYLSRPVAGVFEIERWTTADGGVTWIHDAITAGSLADNVRPFVVRGHGRNDDGPAVLWMSNHDRYEHYTRYRASIKMDRPERWPHTASLDPDAVRHVMELVGNWQLDHPGRHATTDWTNGALYAGVMTLAGISESERFENAMLETGRANAWKPGPRPGMADDHCVGQMYLELYMEHGDPAMLAPIRATFDTLAARPHDESLEWKNGVHDREWAWCDALFMGPPTLARLAVATGDEKYLDLLDRLWWKTTDYLYDDEEHLYYRDSRYFDRREANGAKVFWSRGNGWAIAGLARTLDVYPADRDGRARYERLFVEMAERIASTQRPDGFWSASLLDAASYPSPETSGTGFYCFALAWGIDRGLLDRDTYLPHVERAWRALVSCVDSNGMLRWVQPVGQDPRHARPTDTDVYGVGAFLLAGSAVHGLSE